MTTLKKVLVVDDDPVVGKSFDRVLSGKGYAVITARDGEEALSKLSSETYDLVYTDIKMPGMSGLEVAERVKASQPWLPVVIITGYGTDANEARAGAAGVADFLRKPLSPEMIEGSAHKALLEKAAGAAAPAEVPAILQPVAAEKESARGSVGLAIKNVALFFAAPFIGLAYILAFPFVGLGMLAWMGSKTLMQRRAPRKVAIYLKNVGMFVIAPFVGLAYIIAFPFIGFAMLAWIGIKSLAKRAETE
jgi:CheY-like chemotaxis protein